MTTQGGDTGGVYSRWADLSPGQLKQQIEAAFEGADPGEYYALIVQVENPISGYRIVKVKTG